mmetsp:Transcript_18300/g.30062  ORF Transcript_18300/g.30062 Transcript_18300/m.30062 type:complete len:149 (-) Transcript_18300:629-1075(-)
MPKDAHACTNLVLKPTKPKKDTARLPSSQKENTPQNKFSKVRLAHSNTFHKLTRPSIAWHLLCLMSSLTPERMINWKHPKGDSASKVKEEEERRRVLQLTARRPEPHDGISYIPVYAGNTHTHTHTQNTHIHPDVQVASHGHTNTGYL